MPTLEEIRAALAGHAPSLQPADGRGEAAVAMVLRSRGSRPEVLFIERARKDGDPWSGHMAFPGGRRDPGDTSVRQTAERETREEVGLELAGAEVLGRLDDLEGRRDGRPAGLVISAFVYHLERPGMLRTNHEVEAAFWVPLRALIEPHRQVRYRWRRDRGALGMPGIRVGEADPHVVWGLTYRFVESFLEILGRRLPGDWPAAAERV